MIWLILISLLFFFQQPSGKTKPSDKMPPPDMDYFVGTWSFEWNVPDSALGPGGKMKGTETYKKAMPSGVYESEIQGEGPQGPFQGRALTSYDPDQKLVSRYETYSYGLSVLKTGPIGGDLGGYYTIYWESQPIKKDGHVIKMKGKTLMRSPASYRVETQISIDDGPFSSYGSPWFEKQDAKPPG
jgi:hypothetical protein